jgi:hypothetical protein
LLLRLLARVLLLRLPRAVHALHHMLLVRAMLCGRVRGPCLLLGVGVRWLLPLQRASLLRAVALTQRFGGSPAGLAVLLLLVLLASDLRVQLMHALLHLRPPGVLLLRLVLRVRRPCVLLLLLLLLLHSGCSAAGWWGCQGGQQRLTGIVILRPIAASGGTQQQVGALHVCVMCVLQTAVQARSGSPYPRSKAVCTHTPTSRSSSMRGVCACSVIGVTARTAPRRRRSRRWALRRVAWV